MYDVRNAPPSCPRCFITFKYLLLFAGFSFFFFCIGHQSSLNRHIFFLGRSLVSVIAEILLRRRATWKPFRFLFSLRPFFDFVRITTGHNQFNRSMATGDYWCSRTKYKKRRWKWHSIHCTNVFLHFVSQFEFFEFVIRHFI